MTRKRRGGVGSNQYATRGTPTAAAGAGVSAEIRDALDREQTAWAFTSGATAETRGLFNRKDMQSLLRRAAHPDPHERAKVAALKSCPAEIVAVIVHDDDPVARAGAARSPNLTAEGVAVLRADPSPPVRVALLSNRVWRTDPDLLTGLLTDPDPMVRRSTVRRSELTAEQLTGMADDPDWSVRVAVADRAVTPVKVLRHLAADDEVAVRVAVAGNKRATAAVLGVIADSHPMVFPVAEAMTRNKNITPALLERLGGEDDYCIRFEVAAHPKTPVPVLEQLSRAPEWAVRLQLSRNPNSTTAIIRDTFASAPDTDDPEQFMIPEWHAALAEHPNTPPDVLTVIAGADSPMTRFAVAVHPHCTDADLRRLADDPSGAVRETAAIVLRDRGGR